MNGLIGFVALFAKLVMGWKDPLFGGFWQWRSRGGSRSEADRFGIEETDSADQSGESSVGSNQDQGCFGGSGI